MSVDWVEKECPICGKTFIPAPFHVYKTGQGEPICSYHCLLAYQRKANAKRRNPFDIRNIPVEKVGKDGKVIKKYRTIADAAYDNRMNEATVRKRAEDGKYSFASQSYWRRTPKTMITKEIKEQWDRPIEDFQKNVKCCYNCKHWRNDSPLAIHSCELKTAGSNGNKPLTAWDWCCTEYAGGATEENLICKLTDEETFEIQKLADEEARNAE